MIAGGTHCLCDWTALPGELLACIRSRLPPADFSRFPAVCTAWRRRTAPSTPAPQLPWLLLPPSSSSYSSSSPGDGVTCRFFSPSEGRTYLVPVPELRGTRCVGSCEGWVASFHGATAELSLVNPLTRAQIPLPSPFPSVPEVTAVRDAEGRIVQYISSGEKEGNFFHSVINAVRGLANNVVMSSMPTDPSCKLAAILDSFLPPLSISVGGEKWKVLPAAQELLDVVYHTGDSKYYGLTIDNRVLRWNADAAAVEHCWAVPDTPGRRRRCERHLAVHRPSGDLLLISIDFQGPPWLQDAVEVPVRAFRYKGGDGGSPGAWLRLESLDGCSLFLARNGSQPICLSAQDVPELRADCIFFVGQNQGSDDMGTWWVYTLWVYDLKGGILEPYYPDWRSKYQEPLWFMPNLS